MKKKIRHTCFETNSSSQHSIVITKNNHILNEEDFEDYPEHLYIDKNGEWDIAWDEEDMQFDRHPFAFLCTFREKVRFAIASLCGGYIEKEDREEIFNEIVKVLQTINPKIKSVKLPLRDEYVYFDKDGNLIPESIVRHDYETGRYYFIKNGQEYDVSETTYFNRVPYYGYVDHQSMGLLQDFLKSENIALENFLRNKKYVVIIDGDEYDDWEGFKYSGLINIANIEKEFGV